MQFLEPDDKNHFGTKEPFSMESSFDKAFKETTSDFGDKEDLDFGKEPDKNPFGEVNDVPDLDLSFGDDDDTTSFKRVFKISNEKPKLTNNFGSNFGSNFGDDSDGDDDSDSDEYNFGFGGKPLPFKISDYVKIYYTGKDDSNPGKSRVKTLNKYKNEVGKIVNIGSGWVRVNLKDGSTVGFRSYELKKTVHEGTPISSSFEETKYKRKGLEEGDRVRVKIDGEKYETSIKEVTGNNRYVISIHGDEHTVGRKDLIPLDKKTSPKMSTSKHDLYNVVKRVYGELADQRGSKDHISPMELMTEAEDEYIEVNDGAVPSKTDLKKAAMAVICGSAVPLTRHKSPSKSTRKCKDDQEISEKSGRCIKKCNSDQIRNPPSQRCVSRTGNIGKSLLGKSPKRSPKRSPLRHSPEYISSDLTGMFDVKEDTPDDFFDSPDDDFFDDDIPKKKNLTQLMKEGAFNMPKSESKRRERQGRKLLAKYKSKQRAKSRKGIKCKDNEFYHSSKGKCVKYSPRALKKRRSRSKSLLDLDEPFRLWETPKRRKSPNRRKSLRKVSSPLLRDIRKRSPNRRKSLRKVSSPLLRDVRKGRKLKEIPLQYIDFKDRISPSSFKEIRSTKSPRSRTKKLWNRLKSLGKRSPKKRSPKKHSPKTPDDFFDSPEDDDSPEDFFENDFGARRNRRRSGKRKQRRRFSNKGKRKNKRKFSKKRRIRKFSNQILGPN